jgi:hypothetical protein
MGGIGTLPMDYGQSLQVPQQSIPNYSSAVNITANPLLNYGQPQLDQAGGTPLMMQGGGISRLGYQEGGMGMMEDQMMQPQMQQPTQVPLQGMEGQQLDIRDPRQALELIIQMLIAQGIPPEQAREIAIQMVQAVAEGGMQEMSDERVEARFGGRIGYASGGIGSLVGRQGYFLGDIVKGVTGAVKGVVKGVTGAVKSIVKSDIGKAALTVAALYAAGGGFGLSPEGFTLFGTPGSTAGGLLGSGGAFDLGSSYLGQGLFGAPTVFAPGTSEIASLGSKGLLGNLGITKGFGADLFSGGISSLIPSKSNVLSFLGGTALGGFLGGPPKREDFPDDASYQQAVEKYKAQYQAAINNPNPKFASGLYPNNPFYPQTQMAANGGRIGYQEGGIGDLIKQVTQQEFFGTPMMANGGRIGYSNGTSLERQYLEKKGYGDMIKNMSQKEILDLYDSIVGTFSRRFQAEGSIPMGEPRKNPAGIMELDYRKEGGFVPPIGIKERADDIPAMLSNNEFVFTADAVRNAGNGNVNKGAQRMYGLMKQLESGGYV